MRIYTRETGFSLIEVMLALCLLLLVVGGVFEAVAPAQGAIRVQPEMADLEQRSRVAALTLVRDITQAGAGPAAVGPLSSFVAPVLPYRVGRRNPDPAEVSRPDTISLLFASPGAVHATTTQPLPAQSGSVALQVGPGCPSWLPACGFKVGATVMAVDGSGSFDLFSVTSADAWTLGLQHNQPDSGKIYPPGVTHLVEVVSRTFYLKTDPVSDTFQLTQYDGAGGSDVPLADHVVGLTFEYLGEREPPRLLRSLDEPDGPWTTYGPKPPAADVQESMYGLGENCVFALDESSRPIPRLGVLDGTGPLARIDASMLTDGPWCPDAFSPNRFDADLLRVRAVNATVRVEAAAASLRGSGPAFTRPGTSRDVRRWVADRELRFSISPPNLSLSR